MKYKSDQDHSLILLVNEFETMSQSGEVSFLDEQDFLKLISYYEKEFLFENYLVLQGQMDQIIYDFWLAIVA